MRFSDFACLTCGAPIELGRATGHDVRRSLYCSDDCMRSRRLVAGVLRPRPQELDQLDRGVRCKVARCLNVADAWLGGSGPWTGGYCLDCLELVIDRLEAIAIAPALVLPPLVAMSSWGREVT